MLRNFTLSVCVILFSVLFLGACTEKTDIGYLGYIEGDYIYASSSLGGKLTFLAVDKGNIVEKGQILFSLDDRPEKSAVEESSRRLDQARARLSNLTKGKRPTEIAALQAELQSVRANLNLAEETLKRKNQLIKKQVISIEELDSARYARDALSSKLNEIDSEIETAKLGAREDEVTAAQAEVAALEASAQKASWALEQKTVSAPSAGFVEDTIYRTGEYVQAGSPTVSLLPSENIKIRFFIPETILSRIKLGDTVFAYMDNEPKPIAAKVNFISPRAEFTPPVIFSNQSRSKLVFAIEALPQNISALSKNHAQDKHLALNPGQPVTVFLTNAN